MSDKKNIDAALARLAQATHGEASRSTELIARAGLIHRNMNLAARRLSKVLEKMISEGVQDGDPRLIEVEAEYTKACQTRALMNNVLGSAYTINARIDKGIAGKAGKPDGGTNDSGNDGGGGGGKRAGRFGQKAAPSAAPAPRRFRSGKE